MSRTVTFSRLPSGAFTGRTKLTGQGRPGLRREHNKLRPTQAQTVLAAAILRHLHAVITTGQRWDPAIAAHGTRARPRAAAAA